MLILPAPQDKPLCLTCSPDSRVLYVGCRDGRLLAWDRQGDALTEVFCHPERTPVVKVVAGPGNQLAVACSREIWLVDATSGDGELLDEVGVGSGFVACGPAPYLIYTAHALGLLRAYRSDLRTLRHSATCSGDPLGLAAGASPWVVLGSGRGQSGTVAWWKIEPQGFVPVGSFTQTSPVCSVAVSPRGNCLAAGTRQGRVTLIDPESTGLTQVLGSLQVLDANPPAPLKTSKRSRRRVPPPEVVQGEPPGVFGLAFTPDGRELLTVSSDGDTQRWDVEGQVRTSQLDWGMGRLRALAFAPDGQTAAAIAETNEIVVWDVD